MKKLYSQSNQKQSSLQIDLQKITQSTQKENKDGEMLFSLEQSWSERDLFFIYLAAKHPDFIIIQLQLLPVYLNRTILEIQIVKNKQVFKSKEASFNSWYDLIFANNLYFPSFFDQKKDLTLCKALLQNHLIKDIFDQIQIERETDTQRFIRNFNELNFLRVGYIAGKFMRRNKSKFFSDIYNIPVYAIKELYSNILTINVRFLYQNKLNSLIAEQKKINDPFLKLIFRLIKYKSDSSQFQNKFKKLNLSLQEFVQPFTTQSWYNFLSQRFRDNSLKQIVQFTIVQKQQKISIRQLTQQQQVVLERYDGYFKQKLQKILQNIHLLRTQSARQLELPFIEGILNAKKWNTIKKQYIRLRFDQKFGQNDIEAEDLKPFRTKPFKVKHQQSQQILSKMIQNEQDQFNSLSSLQQEQLNNPNVQGQRKKRRCNRWDQNDQFILFLIDKSGIEQFKNLQKMLKRQNSKIQIYFNQYIQDIRRKYYFKFESYKKSSQSIKQIKDPRLRQVLQQAIKAQQRYEKGKGRYNCPINPVKQSKILIQKPNLNDSATTIVNSQSPCHKKQVYFTQQQEVLMYLLEKTYGLKGLLVQKLLKRPQQDVIQYFHKKNIKQRGSQLQAYYEEYPQLLQFQNNMHIKLLMKKVVQSRQN